jgi:hypothetical protein
VGIYQWLENNMPVQLSFPNGGDFPPEKRRTKLDSVIDHIFQVLPAASVKQIQERLAKRGLSIKMDGVRDAVRHLRKRAMEYQWTIPHVHTGKTTGEEKYFAILVEKDKLFHTDPAFKGHLASGTASIVSRLATESKNQSVMLKSAAEATYISKPLREELREMAEECSSMHNKARRVLRYLKANNG